MTKEELRNKFDNLYAYMAISGEPKYMMLFGDVMKEMMAWMIENKSEAAEKYIEKLCSIKWRQYLSKDEATDIVNNMVPSGAWDYDTWQRAMNDLGLECEREEVFNRYALWAVMNAVHSDDGPDIADMLNNPDKGNPDYIRRVYKFAMNKLLDEDGVFSVRRYFLE